MRVWLLGQYVFLGLLWMLWQPLGHVALWPDYFLHMLIIPAFLALGGLLGGRAALEARLPPMLLVASLLLALVPAFQGAVGVEIVPVVRALMTEGTTVVIVAVCAAAVVLAALFARGIAAGTLVLLGAAAFTFSYLQTESNWVSYLPLANRYWTRASCPTSRRTAKSFGWLGNFGPRIRSGGKRGFGRVRRENVRSARIAGST